MYEINSIGLEIPTGGRQTNVLFTSMTEELNQGISKKQLQVVVRVGLKPVTFRLQDRRSNHTAMLPPFQVD